MEYRAELITTGVCVLRDQTIAGQMTVDDFFTQYESLKARACRKSSTPVRRPTRC